MCIALSSKGEFGVCELTHFFFHLFLKKLHHKMKMSYTSLLKVQLYYTGISDFFYLHVFLQGIDWVQGNAECLPFEDNSFDAYTIAYGIRNCTHVDKVRLFGYQNLILHCMCAFCKSAL